MDDTVGKWSLSNRHPRPEYSTHIQRRAQVPLDTLFLLLLLLWILHWYFGYSFPSSIATLDTPLVLWILFSFFYCYFGYSIGTWILFSFFYCYFGYSIGTLDTIFLPLLLLWILFWFFHWYFCYYCIPIKQCNTASSLN